MERPARLRAIIALGVLYFLSVAFLTAGFFSPWWVVGWRYDRVDGNYWDPGHCPKIGLVSGDCNFNYASNLFSSRGDEVRTLIPVLWMMVTVMIIVYVHLVMLVLMFVSDLHNNQVYISFFSVHTGVLYPIAAIIDLVATIMVETRFGANSGFSVIACTIGGGSMVMFYGGLRMYDHKHIISQRLKSEPFKASGLSKK